MSLPPLLWGFSKALTLELELEGTFRFSQLLEGVGLKRGGRKACSSSAIRAPGISLGSSRQNSSLSLIHFENRARNTPREPRLPPGSPHADSGFSLLYVESKIHVQRVSRGMVCWKSFLRGRGGCFPKAYTACSLISLLLLRITKTITKSTVCTGQWGLTLPHPPLHTHRPTRPVRLPGQASLPFVPPGM